MRSKSCSRDFTRAKAPTTPLEPRYRHRTPPAGPNETAQIGLGREGRGRTLQEAVCGDLGPSADSGNPHLAGRLKRYAQHLKPNRHEPRRVDAVDCHVFAIEAARSGDDSRTLPTRIGVLSATALALCLAARHAARRVVERLRGDGGQGSEAQEHDQPRSTKAASPARIARCTQHPFGEKYSILVK